MFWNMILGPGPSSVATRVMGTGLLENFGWEACRERAGRSEADDGRSERSSDLKVGFMGDLRDVGLEADDDASGVSLLVGGRVEVDAVFFVGVEGSPRRRSWTEDGLSLLAGQSFLVRSGTLTSRSPVDFLDGGGPCMLSLWLFLRRIVALRGGDSVSDSKSSISPSLATLGGPLSVFSASESDSESLPEASLALSWLTCDRTTLGDNL